MTDLETRLAAAFADDAPPQSDALFRIAVLERQVGRAFRFRMAMVVLLGLTASLLLWFWVPMIAGALQSAPLPSGAVNLTMLGVLAGSVGWGLQRAFKVA